MRLRQAKAVGISPKHLVSGPRGCRILPMHFLRCSRRAFGRIGVAVASDEAASASAGWCVRGGRVRLMLGEHEAGRGGGWVSVRFCSPMRCVVRRKSFPCFAEFQLSLRAELLLCVHEESCGLRVVACMHETAVVSCVHETVFLTLVLCLGFPRSPHQSNENGVIEWFEPRTGRREGHATVHHAAERPGGSAIAQKGTRRQ